MNFVNLQTLCQLDGVSGREDAVRQEISNQLSSLAQDIRTDALGNLIAFKKGHTDKNIILCAHMDEVGLMVINSLLVLPAASARNVSKDLRQYHGFSVLFALTASLLGLVISYHLGTSTGAAISLCLAAVFTISFLLRRKVS